MLARSPGRAQCRRDMSGRMFKNLPTGPAVIIGLILLYMLVYLVPLDVRPLSIPDETRYAEIPYEMLIGDDWVTPRLNGLRYFEKPPLGYWLSAISISLLGQSNFAVRLATTLAAGCTVWLLYLFSLRFFANRQTASLAAFVYLTFMAVYLLGTHATLDTLFSLFLTAGIMSYAAATLEQHSSRARFYWLGCGVSLGCAFLTKGFLAFAVPVIVLVPWLIWQRQWRALLVKGWMVVFIAVAVVLPWALLVHFRETDFWHYFFWVEHIKRFTADNAQHKEPFYYFMLWFPVIAFPWTFLLPAAFVGHVKSLNPGNTVINRLLWLWMLVPFLFFSSSSGKLGTYILPCFPPLAILVANGLYRYFQDGSKQHLFNWAVVLNLLVFAGLLFLVTYLQLTENAKAVYADDESLKVWILQASIVITLLVGIISLRLTNWRIRLASMVFFLLPILVLATVSLPTRIMEKKTPGEFLLEIAPLIDENTMIVSDGTMFRALNWYLDRRDIYMLGGNEVTYGLGYPDASHRLLDLESMRLKIQQRQQQPIALFCHYDCPEGIAELIPPGSLQRSFGSFSLMLIK